MRQHTSKEQTQHLIELGFENPQPSFYQNGASWIMCDGNYSIGELLSFLEKYVDDPSEELLVWKDTVFWYVRLSSDTLGAGYDEELINALYKYIVELKEDEQNYGND